MKAGDKFGRWTVIGRHSSDKNGTYWTCLCACGRIGVVKQYNLLNHRSSECQACCRTTAAVTRTLAAAESGVNRLISGYRNKAVARGYIWELTKERVAALVSMACHYCGGLPANTSKGSVNSFKYNGLDRLDNHGGYTRENTVPCCGLCNRWKSDLSVEEFLAHASRIAAAK